jgi:hypothetical protein
MTPNDIKPSAETVMTVDLVKMFAYAGCSPTICHACSKLISVGDRFKLVPHLRRPAPYEAQGKIPNKMRHLYQERIDEMCCDECGSAELHVRDRAQELDWSQTRSGGFSRPSMSSEDMGEGS